LPTDTTSSGPWSTRSGASRSVTLGALRCRNQFEQLVRIVEQISELVLISAERSNRQLRGHARVFQARVRGHKANFVDADSLGSGERRLQLLRQFRRLGLARGKRVDKAAKFFFRDGSKKLHTGQACCAEQLCKLLLRRRPFQRHAIQQELRIRRPQQQPAVCPHRNCGAKFLPGNLQLFVCPGMIVPVQACKLQQDVQASYESASGRCFCVYFHPSPLGPW